MESVIKTSELTKQYKDVKAVSKLNLNVNKGEIYGFLGLNGAGKTTTIRMLLGMIQSTFGNIEILGQTVHANNTRLWQQIGYMVETPHSYPSITVEENLHIIGKLRHIKEKDAIEKIMQQLEISKYRKRLAKNLSLGNKQRLGLAKALIHKPQLLILDEPTNGLDPEGIHDVREFLKKMAKEEGATIFISSHILGEIAKIATRIGIIHNGHLIQELSTNQLDKLCDKQLLIQTTDNEKALKILQEKKVDNIEIDKNILQIKSESAIAHPEEINTLLVNNNCAPTLLQVQEEDLESYFLRTIKTGGLS